MKWDRREIKSFRLKYRIEHLKNIFENSQQQALFLTLNNYSKNDLKKEHSKDSLLVNNVSKKTIKYICNNNALKNLLEGNVIVAQSKTNTLNYKTILENNKISLNFYLSNQQIYRNKEQLKTITVTPNAIYTQLNFAKKNLLQSLYLLQKYNHNSIV